ncbi:hypothetical protein JKP88DRAFT_285737 [Tribonema minus]|uniref:Uncharacterized protein n=1 Tax=Tribonema minus TaxID=303371 RepID=A0A835ZG74_9STRA|nr:hypothetical protein JKP88DRAFT_285737 [Tribonema minus]
MAPPSLCSEQLDALAHEVAAIEEQFDSDVEQETAHGISTTFSASAAGPEGSALRVCKLCSATGVDVEGEAEKMHFLRVLTGRNHSQLAMRGATSDASGGTLSDEEQESEGAGAEDKALATRESQVAVTERRSAKLAAKLEAKEKYSAAATIAAAAVTDGMAAAPPQQAMPPPYARPQRPDWPGFDEERYAALMEYKRFMES